VDVDRNKGLHQVPDNQREGSARCGPCADAIVGEQNILDRDRIPRRVTNDHLVRGIESTESESRLLVRVSGCDRRMNREQRVAITLRVFATAMGIERDPHTQPRMIVPH
jgi:hypothetical protein